MFNFKNMQPVQQGTVGLGLAIAHFISTGNTISLPLNDNQDYDLIVDIDGVLKKIQVKTTRVIQNNNYVVQLKKVRPNNSSNVIHNFDKLSSDILFVLTEDGTKFSIPCDAIDVKTQLTLDERYDIWKV